MRRLIFRFVRISPRMSLDTHFLSRTQRVYWLIIAAENHRYDKQAGIGIYGYHEACALAEQAREEQEFHDACYRRDYGQFNGDELN